MRLIEGWIGIGIWEVYGMGMEGKEESGEKINTQLKNLPNRIKVQRLQLTNRPIPNQEARHPATPYNHRSIHSCHTCGSMLEISFEFVYVV